MANTEKGHGNRVLLQC